MSIEFGSVTSVIKTADVVMGPPVMVGAGSPILQQAEAIASAAWTKADPVASGPAPLELASPAAFFESNINIISIISGFNPQPELNTADVVSEAETILTQAAKPSIGSVELPHLPLIQPEVQQLITPVRLYPNTETRRSVITQVAAPIQQEQEPKELQEGAMKDEFPKSIQEQEEITEEDGRRYLEDEGVSAQRRVELRQTIFKAEKLVAKLGLGKITGWLVARFLPPEYPGIRSQVVKKNSKKKGVNPW